MKRTSKFVRGIIATAGIAALVSVALPAGAAQNSDGNYIVVLKDSVGSAKSVAAEHAKNHGAKTSFVYEDTLKGYAATLSSGRLSSLRNDPRVKYVEPDGVATIDTTQSEATWGLDRIDQRALPLSTTYSYNAAGAGVTAYIIDTGIHYSHTQFGGRAIEGWDFKASNHGADCHGHGTHVAGTVGGSTYGVAKTVTLVAVRVLDCRGSGAWSTVIAGMDWVNSNHGSGPAVANMSLGGGFSSAVNDAVTNSIADGISYAVAAGNSNANACNYSPASTPNALTVAASDSTDKKASFSNYGSCVDVYAPGVGITSSTSTSDSSIGTWSGTSMASPHVAGVAALYLTGSPLSSPDAVSSAVIGNATADFIVDSTTSSGGGGGGRGKKRSQTAASKNAGWGNNETTTTTTTLKPLLFTNY